MNERQERIERLAERWFAAQATDAEERELRDWFRQAAGVPDSLREAQSGFCSRYSTTAQAMARDTRLASAAPMTQIGRASCRERV